MVVSLFQGPGEEPKYKVELLPAEGAVSVSDGSVNVLVGLTSAVMREPAGECARLAPDERQLVRSRAARRFPCVRAHDTAHSLHTLLYNILLLCSHCKSSLHIHLP